MTDVPDDSADDERLPEGQRLPTWADLAYATSQILTERDGEWCGIPMPVKDGGLVIEDRNPYRDFIAGLQAIVDERDEDAPASPPARDDDDGWTVINHWRRRTGYIPGDIAVLRHTDGRTKWGIDPVAPRRNALQLTAVFNALDVWDLRTELAAMERLQTMLMPRMFGAYVLTGSFLETSPRSELTYIFRRLKPTVALTPHKDPHEMCVLACLCLHPIGFYANSFCGAMTPTDDVIAHLMLMRADEHMFWKRANQHHPADPESGL